MTTRPVDGWFDLIDQLRALTSSAAWAGIWMELGKNDAFALLHIYRCDSLTMSQLAGHLGLAANTVTGVVDRLAARGLVARTRQSSDRRVVTISITEDGVAAVSGALRQLARYEAMVLAELDDTEVRVLLGVIGKVLGALRRDLQSAPAAVPAAGGAHRIPID